MRTLLFSALFFITASVILLSCSDKTEVRYTHQVIVHFNNNATVDTVVFHSKIIKGDSFTETGCTITLMNGCLYVVGAEESGLGRCDVRKFEDKILETKESKIQ